MAVEEYTEQQARRYEPLGWMRESAAEPSALRRRPIAYTYHYVCNHGRCSRTSIWRDRFCAEHVTLYERKPASAVVCALRSRPAKAAVFILRWGGVGFLLGLCGLYWWQFAFYAVLIPLCVALKGVAVWQGKD